MHSHRRFVYRYGPKSCMMPLCGSTCSSDKDSSETAIDQKRGLQQLTEGICILPEQILILQIRNVNPTRAVYVWRMRG